MKWIMLFCIYLSQLSRADSYAIDTSVLNAKSVKFIEHQGPGEFDNYLTLSLAFQPVKRVFKELLHRTGESLINRGEAHITVISPIEYWNVLKPKGISMTEVNQIAKKMNIQSSKFKILCLGQGRATLENKLEKTFFLVVESKDLLAIRSAVQKKFINQGGLATDFDPYHYYPHITVGFTKVDLHESNGVIKDSKSCISSVK